MNRRGFLTGLAALAAPAIIRTPGLLMPVKRLALPEFINIPFFSDYDPDGRIVAVVAIGDGGPYRVADYLTAVSRLTFIPGFG